MKNLKKFNVLLALISISVVLMAFIPSTNSNGVINNNSEVLATPDPSSPNNLSVAWKTINVNYRTSGNYYVLYSDLISGLESDHSMIWGCGYLDIDKNTSEWQCTVTKDYYTASGADNCEYIYVHSLAIPEPGYSATHTIDIRVLDDHGVVSTWGAITLIIHNNGIPDNSEPVNPCSFY